MLVPMSAEYRKHTNTCSTHLRRMKKPDKAKAITAKVNRAIAIGGIASNAAAIQTVAE